VLDNLGLDYLAASPDYEEDNSLAIAPEAKVVAFARGKAESLATSYPAGVIIGSDQLAELDGEVLGKPGSASAAVEQLMRMQGRTHRLLTGVAVHVPATGVTRDGLVVHEMTMRRLTRELAAAYVRRDDPVNCAGSYKIESLGLALFERMRGDDHSAIIGLPVSLTASLLSTVGVDLLERIL